MCQICVKKNLLATFGNNPEALASIAATAFTAFLGAAKDAMLLTHINHTLLNRFNGSTVLSQSEREETDSQVTRTEEEQGEGSCIIVAHWLSGKPGEGDLHLKVSTMKDLKRDTMMDVFEQEFGIPLRDMASWMAAQKAAQATQPGSEAHTDDIPDIGAQTGAQG